MDELIIFGICAVPVAFIVWVMILRRKTHCWECGAELTEEEAASGRDASVIACGRCGGSTTNGVQEKRNG